MFFISHRGNIFGRKQKDENHPEYILEAISQGFDVEVDVRSINSELFLGHDEPLYKINFDFLENEKIWCHAKDTDTASILNDNKKVHFFFHENDQLTLTNKGYLWTYPGKKIYSKSICVLPEQIEMEQNLKFCAGICSDKISYYKQKYD